MTGLRLPAEPAFAMPQAPEDRRSFVPSAVFSNPELTVASALQEETNRILFWLRSQEMTEWTRSLGSYSEIREAEQKTRSIHFGYYGSSNWFLDIDTDYTEFRIAALKFLNIHHSDDDMLQFRAAVYTLWLSTTRDRNISDEDRNAMLKTYLSAILPYPRHAILSVLEELSNTEQWWPPKAKILNMLSDVCAARGRLIRDVNLAEGKLKLARNS